MAGPGKARIFEPIGMKGAGFYVPKGKWDRFATLFKISKQGERVPVTQSLGGITFSSPPSLPSGGGLLSTAHDSLRLARMQLSGGVEPRLRNARYEAVDEHLRRL